MNVIKMEVGPLGTNCYIVSCKETRQAAIIDPGGNAGSIIACLKRDQLQTVAIINTHGHADHIAANAEVKQVTQAPVMIHADDAGMLTSSSLNLSAYIGGGLVLEPADRLLQEGDVIRIGNLAFTVIHTPGHTPGGICLSAEGILFSGDTLFHQSVGRTDLPGGSMGKIVSSIREKLFILPGNTKVFPGHGAETSIAWEVSNNPFV